MAQEQAPNSENPVEFYVVVKDGYENPTLEQYYSSDGQNKTEQTGGQFTLLEEPEVIGTDKTSSQKLFYSSSDEQYRYRYFKVTATPIEYKIEYVLDGGNNASENPDKYTVEDTITLAAPTRTGYTFTGWTWEGQDTPQTTAVISEGSTGNKTFTAHWIENPPQTEKVTITFNGNGGTPSTSSQTIDKGASLGTLPSVTKHGYKFAGWYTNPTGGTRITSSTTFSTNTTVYAHWEGDFIEGKPSESDDPSVSYNPNYGGKTWCTRSYNKNDKVYVEEDFPSWFEKILNRDGYTLTGWKDQNTGTVYLSLIHI